MRKTIASLFILLAITTSSCSSESSDPQPATTTINFFSTDNTVSKETVLSWPAKFCSLTIGMSRKEVQAIMGTPTSTFSDSNANQDEWDGYNVNVTAFYDINDNVQQLDDSTGTSKLPCDVIRSNKQLRGRMWRPSSEQLF
jgi:outer membrane protein assembly factor BamE (lipoprotein component of BamABCDE complex)